jgi:hypothetical protein
MAERALKASMGKPPEQRNFCLEGKRCAESECAERACVLPLVPGGDSFPILSFPFSLVLIIELYTKNVDLINPPFSETVC